MSEQSVTVMEVSPRDGLQNESARLTTEEKITLVERALDAGARRIEVTSFVHPKVVPQMADAAEVVAGLPPRSDICYVALIPNEKGYERALAAGLKHVGLVLSATETMNQKNLNMSVPQSMAIAKRLLQRAKSDELTVRVDVSVAFVCAYEGVVDPQKVIAQTEELFRFGADQVCLCDTTGRADPRQVAYLFDEVRRRHGSERLAGHFHNTYGMAIANTLAAMQQGIAFFDASIAGLGGCPYSPGATGNTPTEDVVYLCRQMGVETGIDLEKLCDVSELVRTFSGKLPPSAYYRATRIKQTDGLTTM